MASDESELLYLRPEAQPIEQWDRLTEYQKKGLEHLLNMLREAVGKNAGDDNQPRQKRLPWLFAETKTRLAFINGFRGTGKTTLMTTLVGAIDEPEALKEGQPGDDIEQGRFKAVKQLAADLHNQVIPVQPLDMEGLPPNTPLLAAILARVYRAAQDYTQDFDAPRGLLADDPADNREARRLKMFQQRVAKALDSNLRVRMGNLDPDQFAEAVMAEEDNRLGMVRDLEQVLSDLSKTLREKLKRSSRVKAPDGQLLFIVPIDDVDLNPHRCLELLRLLRTFSPPRELFFLLMGQYDLVESIFKLQIAADYGQIRKDGAAMSPEFFKPLQNRLAEVSAAIVSKMIPPRAHIRLPGMSTADVLAFYPLGRSNTKTNGLQTLFQSIPIVTRDGKRARFPTLAALLTGGRSEPGEFSTPADLACGIDAGWDKYCALGSYQISARRLADVWIELRQLSSESGNPTSATSATTNVLRMSEIVQDHWKRAVDADIHLDATLRDKLVRHGPRACFTVPNTEPLYELDLDISDAAVDVQTGEPTPIHKAYRPRLRLASLRPGTGVPQFVFGGVRRDTNDDMSNPLDGVAIEHEQTRCAVVLYNDIQELMSGDIQSSGKWPDLTSVLPVVMTWIGPGGEVASYPWPLPPLPTYVETTRFLANWRAACKSILDSAPQSEGAASSKSTPAPTPLAPTMASVETVARLAERWTALGLTAIEESLHGTLDEAHCPSPLDDAATNWNAIAERLYVLREAAKTSNHLRGWEQLDKWLRRISQLVQPEVCSPAVSSQLLQAIHGVSRQKHLEALVEHTRGILEYQRRLRIDPLWEQHKEFWRKLNREEVAKLLPADTPPWLLLAISEPATGNVAMEDIQLEIRSIESRLSLQIRQLDYKRQVESIDQQLESDVESAERRLNALQNDLGLEKRLNSGVGWISQMLVDVSLKHARALESLSRTDDAMAAFKAAANFAEDLFTAEYPMGRSPHDYWEVIKTVAKKCSANSESVGFYRKWLDVTADYYLDEGFIGTSVQSTIDRGEARWLCSEKLPKSSDQKKLLRAQVKETITELVANGAPLSPVLKSAKSKLRIPNKKSKSSTRASKV